MKSKTRFKLNYNTMTKLIATKTYNKSPCLTVEVLFYRDHFAYYVKRCTRQKDKPVLVEHHKVLNKNVAFVLDVINLN